MSHRRDMEISAAKIAQGQAISAFENSLTPYDTAALKAIFGGRIIDHQVHANVRLMKIVKSSPSEFGRASITTWRRIWDLAVEALTGGPSGASPALALIEAEQGPLTDAVLDALIRRARNETYEARRAAEALARGPARTGCRCATSRRTSYR